MLSERSKGFDNLLDCRLSQIRIIGAASFTRVEKVDWSGALRVAATQAISLILEQQIDQPAGRGAGGAGNKKGAILFQFVFVAHCVSSPWVVTLGGFVLDIQ